MEKDAAEIILRVGQLRFRHRHGPQFVHLIKSFRQRCRHNIISHRGRETEK